MFFHGGVMDRRTAVHDRSDGCIRRHPLPQMPSLAADDRIEAARPQLRDMFREHHDFVWRLVSALGAPAGAVDDVVQEVFLVVARKLPSYDDRGSARGWIGAIARRVAADHRKMRARATAREQSAAVPDAPADPEVVVAQRQGAAAVQALLDSLPEDQREVFLLMDVEGLTAPEAATALAIGVNTIYSRLRLARRRFDALCEQWRAEQETP